MRNGGIRGRETVAQKSRKSARSSVEPSKPAAIRATIQTPAPTEWVEKKFTIADAVDYLTDSPTPDGQPDGHIQEEFNGERVIRSVAFLLDYLSDGGNEYVYGFAVSGLADALKTCAERGFERARYARSTREPGSEHPAA